MNKQECLKNSRLKEVLHYNPNTGLFTWKLRISYKIKVGMEAGTINSRGYITITIDRKLYLAHRLAWFYMTGRWPQDQIDHIDGDKRNNRWINIREADNTLNQRNKYKPRKDNKSSGLMGVRFQKDHYRTRPWEARIKVDGKQKYLGYFFTPREAHEAYLTAKNLLCLSRQAEVK